MNYDLLESVQLTEGWVNSNITPKKGKKGKKKKPPFGFYQRKENNSNVERRSA